MSTKLSNESMSDKSIAILEEMAGMKLTLGNFLWAIRESDEQNQTEFSRLLGVSRQYLCDIEQGRRIVSPKMAAALAKRLGYSPVQFVRLALQDELNKAGLHYEVQLQVHAKAA